MNEIERDFDNDKLKEEINYPISITRKTAEAKLYQLKDIILALVSYYQIEK
ncbi:hypothetical protein KO495_12930 [Colwellia sp. D2M02]|uniref:hypothetical protein n=1 Tax=Colwellia sp. D2M02 TaxID=2841562 RepID=UPI001C089433|nr:hypothetical protein [Colwellia sp. D2M02]MBU2894218.1 hypothetical protein [Colwellia sp. D2M02]